MAGQPRHMDLDDPLQRKFIEEFPDKLFKGCPSAGAGIAIDRPEMPEVQHEATRHQLCHEPEKMGNRYRAGRKICKRRHFQKEERRHQTGATTMPIYRLLNRRDIFRDHLRAQPSIQWRDIGAK